MAGTGTGQPLTFRCAKCKILECDDDLGGTWVEATGKVRGNDHQPHYSRVLWYHVQYRCLDCGHVGWWSSAQGSAVTDTA